jgi:hypothetical protein
VGSIPTSGTIESVSCVTAHVPQGIAAREVAARRAIRELETDARLMIANRAERAATLRALATVRRSITRGVADRQREYNRPPHRARPLSGRGPEGVGRSSGGYLNCGRHHHRADRADGARTPQGRAAWPLAHVRRAAQASDRSSAARALAPGRNPSGFRHPSIQSKTFHRRSSDARRRRKQARTTPTCADVGRLPSRHTRSGRHIEVVDDPDIRPR